MPVPVKGTRGQRPAVPEEPKPLRPAPPIPPEAEEPQEVAVELPQIQFDPVQDSIEARVVYLGGNPKKSVYYPGSVSLGEAEEGGKIWVPSSEGATTYDFSRYSNRGKLIKERLTSDGKVWCLCRHIDHLTRFMDEVDEDQAPQFRVMCKPSDKARLERFARLKLERRLKSTESGPALLAQMGLNN